MNITMRELRAKLAYYLDLAAAGTPVHVERKGKTVVLLPAYEGGLPPGPLSGTFKKDGLIVDSSGNVLDPDGKPIREATIEEAREWLMRDDPIPFNPMPPLVAKPTKPPNWKERNAAQAARDALLGGGKK